MALDPLQVSLPIKKSEKHRSDDPDVRGIVDEIVVPGMGSKDAHPSVRGANAIELADHAEEDVGVRSHVLEGMEERTSTMELVSHGQCCVSASKTESGWQTGDLSRLRKPGMELKPQPMFSFWVLTAVEPKRSVGAVCGARNDRLIGFIS